MTGSSLLVCALAAYCVHEHQEGHVRAITITLDAGGFTLEDDGRGIGLHRQGYVENLMGTLVGGPGPVQLHGVGLSVVAASVPKLRVESCREGQVWTQSFAWGLPEGPIGQRPASTPATGTRMVVTLPAGAPDVLSAELDAQVAVWQARHPGLSIRVRPLSG